MNKSRYILSLCLVIVLQNAVVSNWTVFGVAPALTLLYVVGLTLLYGPMWGGYTGLGLGLLQDIIFSDVLGVRALLFFVGATVLGHALYHNDRNYATGTLATALFSVFVLVGQWLIFFLLRMPLSGTYMLGGPMLVYAILNAVLFTPVMWLMQRWMKPENVRRFGTF